MSGQGRGAAAVLERPARAGASNGGVPARRAVIRWAWRLLRREWRQQLLILALITVAVAATFVGSAVATDTPPPAGAGFGTATDMATFPSLSPHVAAEVAALAHRFGRVEVIENETFPVPGSVTTYGLRAQNPHGRVRPADALAGERALPQRGGPDSPDQRGRIGTAPQGR